MLKKIEQENLLKRQLSKLQNLGNNSESLCRVFLENVVPLKSEKKLPRTTRFATNKFRKNINCVYGGSGGVRGGGAYMTKLWNRKGPLCAFGM